MAKDPKEVWREALAHIQLVISRTHFKAWFSHSYIETITETTITIAAKNKIAKEYFEHDFSDVILEALTKAVGKSISVKVIIGDIKQDVDKKEELPPLFTSEQGIDIRSTDERQEEYMESARVLGLNPKYTFESFIVGASNRLAHAAAIAVAEKPGYAYNPLFIYGDVGLGKTHLIQAIANTLLLKNPKYKIVYSPSEVFLNEMVSSIKGGNPEQFRRKYREKDMLIIDDIQFIQSKKAMQEEVFHTFNSMYQYNKQIIIISDRPPGDMPFLEARLRSRFEGGMVVDVNKPEFETRLAILQKKDEERGYHLNQEILQFVAEKYEENVRELEGALIKLGSTATIRNESVTLQDAMRTLGVKTTKKNLRLKPSDIITAVCENYNISLKEIKSPIRTERIAYTRHIAMYMLRTELQLPFTEVARILNRKDHTTVMHAVERIETLTVSSETTQSEIESIKRNLKG